MGSRIFKGEDRFKGGYLRKFCKRCDKETHFIHHKDILLVSDYKCLVCGYIITTHEEPTTYLREVGQDSANQGGCR